MKKEYTPSTREVRDAFGRSGLLRGKPVAAERMAAFDRWLDQHDRDKNAGLLAEVERLLDICKAWKHENGIIAGQRDAAQAERDRLRAREEAIVKRLWAAFGCAPNPDAFKESVRDVLVGEMERFARESENRSSRVDRDNRRLRAQVEAVRAEVEQWDNGTARAVLAILNAADGGAASDSEVE